MDEASSIHLRRGSFREGGLIFPVVLSERVPRNDHEQVLSGTKRKVAPESTPFRARSQENRAARLRRKPDRWCAYRLREGQKNRSWKPFQCKKMLTDPQFKAAPKTA